jgi:hypothetical protein
MSLIPRKFLKKNTDVEIIQYRKDVPFYNMCSVCEHTLDSNDEITVLDHYEVVSANAHPIPGFGSIYRLIGDGTHVPTFAATLKKSSGSGDYDPTTSVVNLIVFLFDGVDYWYSISQAK